MNVKNYQFKHCVSSQIIRVKPQYHFELSTFNILRI